MKKLFALCLAAVVALGLAACGGSTSSSAAASEPGTSDAASSAAASVAAAGKDPANCKIGVIQLTEHVALDAARDGFIDALVEAGFNRENIDVQNAPVSYTHLDVYKRQVYDPSCHHYEADPPTWTEIEPGHFVLANQEELEKYRTMI